MSERITKEVLDTWVEDDGPAAVTRRTYLEPVEGADAVIFPPTYPIQGQEAAGYNIDELPPDEPGGRSIKVCQIDSVGSQANRIEPLFARAPCDKLVPQVVIEAGEHSVNLLEAGHRIADAVVRCSSLADRIDEAMQAIKAEGDATQMAKLAPTSLVFGFWDSRETQVKMPRIVRSVIRAFDVDVLRRSAQYSTTAGVILFGEKIEPEVKGKKAERGFAHVPAVHTHGGILVRGEIRQDSVLNLAALRCISAKTPTETGVLRRYILGLALVAFAAPQPTVLREGCELVPRLENGKPTGCTRLVDSAGQREEFPLTSDAVLEYAGNAAAAFGVGNGGTFVFDTKAAEKDLKRGKS